MRIVAVMLVCALMAAGAPARADDTTSTLAQSEQDAIRSVISGQIGAFRSGDDGRAFGFASPHIQAMFGDAANFVEMVRHGYPPVFRPSSMAFGPLVEIDGRLVQKVQVVGPDGRPALALYSMEREADGTWRIDGCQLTASDAVGA